ncbi:MAG TPA: glycine betaine ABC transporter substrate-binding protein [Halanaerobiales bacterium]|nr:glycine betaine ABC transporter substrate-binding protein [Halanaerobiales bacterium]
MKKTLLALIAVFLMIGLLSGNTMAQDDTITLGEGDWPGIRAKNSVVEVIIESMGYEVERMTARDPLIHQGLTQGDVDIHLGSWMPQILDMREKYKGDYDYVTQNMTEGLYTLAVPQYVWEEGVKTQADLQKYPEKFDKKIYVGPNGWASSKKMNEAKENNIYGLGDWSIINSSQSAMMAQIEKSIDNKDWIVFAGWRPHWMNSAYNLKYLEDPKRLWESPYSWVDTLVRKGFEDDYPQVYRFLQQFRVNVEDNDKWIYEIGYNERDGEEVAREWLSNNIIEVRRWLSMVETKDGQDAYNVLKEELGIE